VATIASASAQQEEAVNQINAAVEEMNRMTQSAAADAQHGAATAKELAHQSGRLDELVASFTLTEAGAASRRPMSRRSTSPKGPAVRALAQAAGPPGGQGPSPRGTFPPVEHSPPFLRANNPVGHPHGPHLAGAVGLDRPGIGGQLPRVALSPRVQAMTGE